MTGVWTARTLASCSCSGQAELHTKTGETDMKNAGITIGMVAIGLGLASIGFNLNGNTATATPAA